jgi:hypothetical protein
VFEGIRKKLHDRRNAKARAKLDRAAAENEVGGLSDERRARDLPDPVGEFDEIQRMGPAAGGPGNPSA